MEGLERYRPLVDAIAGEHGTEGRAAGGALQVALVLLFGDLEALDPRRLQPLDRSGDLLMMHPPATAQQLLQIKQKALSGDGGVALDQQRLIHLREDHQRIEPPVGVLARHHRPDQAATGGLRLADDERDQPG